MSKKELRFAIISTLNFIFMSFAYSENLVEGIVNYDFPSVDLIIISRRYCISGLLAMHTMLYEIITKVII